MRTSLGPRFVLVAAAALAVNGEIIDRIAVTVGNRVITESMVYQQIRLAAFQDGREPQFDPASRRQAAATLVSQTLLIQEMDDSRYPEPAMADILPQVEKLVAERFRSPEAYAAELAKRLIEAQDFVRFLQQQQRAYSFIDVRFRTGLQVGSEEIAAYYEKEFKAEWSKRSPQTAVPTMDDVSSDIEEILMGRKLDVATADWLKQAEATASIRYREEAFE